jgi:hypothetical protein
MVERHGTDLLFNRAEDCTVNSDLLPAKISRKVRYSPPRISAHWALEMHEALHRKHQLRNQNTRLYERYLALCLFIYRKRLIPAK